MESRGADQDEPGARLRVEGLRISLPDGRPLIDDLTISVAPGEAVVLLGGSGAGKSTFSRVLFEPDALAAEGFQVQADKLHLDRGELGLVPQRGALFDHLDVAGNVEIAQRYGGGAGRGAGEGDDVIAWLERVGLDRELAVAGTKVTSLSGGQAQRLAVARALAGGRKLLFLDEPSVGLDPHRVRTLARLVREQCARGASAIVVTHDVGLAAAVGDRLYVLDPGSRKAELLFGGEWPGALERQGVTEEERARWSGRIERELVERIERGGSKVPPPPHRGWVGPYHVALTKSLRRLAAPFTVAGSALRRLPRQLLARPRDFLSVALRVARQTVVRPFAFYLIVSALIGYTVLYVISKLGGPGVGAQAGIKVVGGSYVVALAPVLSAVLYVAASANATNAWLGSMGLTRQTAAMQALGVDTRAYVWAPTWLALALGYLVVVALFALGMLLGGLALCKQHGVPDAWSLLTADLIDPRPERSRWVARALFLAWAYAWGIASDAIAKGADDKREADDVTHGMTRSVVACTLWVVVWELATAVVLFAR